MTRINDLLYALMDSNFDNIKANIESIKKVFQDTYAIQMEIDFHFDASEHDVWFRTTRFKFLDAQNQEIYSYSKAGAMVARQKCHARRSYEEYKERYPFATVIWNESEFADKYP